MTTRATKKTPHYYFVAADVAPERAEDFGVRLFDMGAQGVEERDETTLVKGKTGRVTVVASFATEELAKQALAKLPKSAGGRIEELVGDAWRDAWKEHFRPFRLCPGLWIRPPWEKMTPPEGEHVLELEPGRAFGTGLHETTSLVARIMASQPADLKGARILDVGTGSGILALVGLALGGKEALGIDVDVDAIAVARENAARNRMQRKAHFETTPLARVPDRFEVVVANIEADTLIKMKKNLSRRVDPGGLLVLSGILSTRREDVIAAFGLPLRAIEHGEWTGLAYRTRA